jgi:hypothetical protein
MKILRFMIAFIIIFIAWQLGRWIVLPHLQIFPYIPPNPLWEGLYSVLLSISTAIFHYIILFILILYALYLIIDNFLRWIFPPFSIIIAEILLAMTPFKEIRESGLKRLFDRIFFSIIPIPKRFTEKLKDVASAIGEYLYSSLGFTGEILNELLGSPIAKARQKIREQQAELTGDIKETITNVGTSITKETGMISDAILKSDPLPKNQYKRRETSSSSREEQYLEKKYEQCLIERNKPYTGNMTGIERTKVALSNSVNNTICSAQKIKDKLQLAQYSYTK